jgi:hypothetical protein
VKEYPDAGHWFMNNHQSIFFKVLRFVAIAYNEPGHPRCPPAHRRVLSHASSAL